MKNRIKRILVLGAFLLLLSPSQASEPFIGEIKAVGFNFCPRGWAKADGQLIPITENQALFSLLGTTYGGDGRTSFALPDLRGRVPIHNGNGPGLPDKRQGQTGGSVERTLSIANLPSHSHGATATLQGSEASPNTSSPSEAVFAESQIFTNADGVAPSSNATLNAESVQVTVGNTGGSQAFSIESPYLTVNYCIALEGIFPARSNEALPNE